MLTNGKKDSSHEKIDKTIDEITYKQIKQVKTLGKKLIPII